MTMPLPTVRRSERRHSPPFLSSFFCWIAAPALTPMDHLEETASDDSLYHLLQSPFLFYFLNSVRKDLFYSWFRAIVSLLVWAKSSPRSRSRSSIVRKLPYHHQSRFQEDSLHLVNYLQSREDWKALSPVGWNDQDALRKDNNTVRQLPFLIGRKRPDYGQKVYSFLLSGTILI